MEISSRYVKISGNFEIDSDLDIGRDYNVIISGSIIACTEKDDESGGMEREYRFRPSTGQIADTLGLSVKLVDKTRKSVKFRQLIERVWGDDYDQDMNILLAHSDEVKSLIEKYK